MSLQGIFDPMVRAYFKNLYGGSGGSSTVGEALDPDEVYRATRPSDWLPLPTPGDNEMYVLGQLIEGIDNKFGVKADFNASGGSCSVEIGNLVDGVFVAKHSASLAKNVAYVYDIPYEEYGDVTANGYRQYMVRLVGNKIISIGFAKDWCNVVQNIVDAVIGISNCVVAFGSTGDSLQSVHSLRYLRYVGNGYPPMTQGMVGYCENLLCVCCEKDFVNTSPGYAFPQCESLLAISPSLGASIGAATYNQCGLRNVPTPVVIPADLSSVFRESHIESMDGSAFGSVTSMNATFYFAQNLRKVTNLNISSLKVANSTVFGYCASLQKLTFAGETTPGGITLNLTQTVLGHTALVEMINSLPTATAAATITLTGLAGAAELTEGEIAVATAKNWTITI